jgi:ornithine cyclodeaminase
VAGVKVVGDFVENYRSGLPSEMALLNLFDPTTGQPLAVLDAIGITAMRTGAMTALGARYLAPGGPAVVGHIGSRGTAYWNVRLLAHVLDVSEVRVHARRPESREALARTVRELGINARALDTWEECVRGANVVVEASRLPEPQPLLRTAWIEPGVLLIPYGTMSALEDDVLEAVDKVVVDDWTQATVGPFGALRRHVDRGLLTRASVHAELSQIACGGLPGREREDETILFWHRGLAITDIALGDALVREARRRGIGTVLPYRHRDR